MKRGSFRRGLSFGLLAAAVVAALKWLVGRRRPVAPPASPPVWPPLSESGPATEVHIGADAVEHFADATRQQDRPLSDWEPTAPLPEAEQTTPLTPAAVDEREAPPWVEPIRAACPPTHPVKGKRGSQIFHLPGGVNYERTHPDRCYVDAAAAEADGLRPAKR